MNKNSIYSCNQKVGELFLQMEPEKIQQEIGHLSEEQIVSLLPLFNEKGHSDWQRKVRASFLGLDDRKQLEALGRALNYVQMLVILLTAAELESVHHGKLLSLFVGLPTQVFEEVLLAASAEQLQVLKQEGIAEPIQHHLTMLLANGTQKIERASKSLEELMKEIALLDAEKTDYERIEELNHLLVTLSVECQRIADEASIALAVAWNTPRCDLIEKLTLLKEVAIKYSIVTIGHSSPSAHMRATGLYALLNQQLEKVYGGSLKGEDVAERVPDDAPAIEGLAKLGVWYLQDYWLLGLLPGVEERELLKQEEFPALDREHIKQREKLYLLAGECLQRIALMTVKDLKNAGIYSRELLKSYIQKHQSKLTVG